MGEKDTEEAGMETTDPTLIVDDYDVVRFANEAAVELFGPGDLVGKMVAIAAKDDGSAIALPRPGSPPVVAAVELEETVFEAMHARRVVFHEVWPPEERRGEDRHALVLKLDLQHEGRRVRARTVNVSPTGLLARTVLRPSPGDVLHAYLPVPRPGEAIDFMVTVVHSCDAIEGEEGEFAPRARERPVTAP